MRKNRILPLFILVGISCTSGNVPLNKNVSDSAHEIKVKKDAPYTLKLHLEYVSPNELNLIASMELKDGAFFASPYSAKTVKGHFNISLSKSDKVELEESFIENPRSEKVQDDFGGNVHWVRVNTIYTKKLRIKTDNNFKVKGTVQFVIEPRCTMEKIDFVVSRKNNTFTLNQK